MSAEDSFRSLLQRVKNALPYTHLSGVRGLGAAHCVYEMSAIRPVVLVAKNQVAADDLLRDLRYCAGPGNADQIWFLPADERTPYHTSSPDPLVVMERSATLYKLVSGVPFRVMVVPPEAMCRRQLSFAALQRMAGYLEEGEEIERDELVEKLVVGGYNQVNTIEDPGTFAVRGSIIDVFWPGLPKPFRIDLFGDEIESLKLFDPSTQRTSAKLSEISFGPAREVHLDDETIPRAKQRLRDLADELDFPTKRLRELLSDLENRIPFFGIEGLLPALHPELELPVELLTRALGEKGFTIAMEDAEGFPGAVEELFTDFVAHRLQAERRGDLSFPPEAFLESTDSLLARFERHPRVDLGERLVENDASLKNTVELRCEGTLDVRNEILRETMRTDEVKDPLAPLAQRIRQMHKKGRLVLLPVASHGGTDRLKEILRGHQLDIRVLKEEPSLFDGAQIQALKQPSVHAYTYVSRPTAPAHGGDLPHMSLCVIAEDEVFGKRARRSGSTGKTKGFKTTLADLEVDDAIVHVEHGIGIFRGLTRLNVRGVEQDFVLLTYAGDDKLYLPVHRINLIQKYSGADGRKPRIDKLGGTSWKTTRKKVKTAVLAIAQELLNLYAKRELATRRTHPAPEGNYFEFESKFPFEPTPDQQKAIDEVMQDMTRERPMDRLICGDVGYGKTEVGMRAAMLCVLGSRQVAVLAPTTVLAQQHYLTFKERFAGSGAQIEVISRFKKAAEVKDILKRTKEGKVDILIGTHRLLSHDVGFKDIGLIMVDEEQRFGVKAKEALKKYRSSVDVLTLTATPIPRTLQMGFFGIRDLSVIETPPVDRRAIRTSITRFDDEVIREAILRELGRGGQVYFVHNRVRSIHALADYLGRLVPEARIGVAHGQMEEGQLEAVMLRFMKRETNVLLCTAIIETGIDVPSANTMFIDNADDFGLAQLYQLRGRVGRSKERAFAYLLIPSSAENLTPDARKRLEVLQRFSELGAGFKVAQHDLELRGAGDMLGKSQHGHVTAVGYDMYAELLKEAVEELKGRQHEEVPDPDIKLPIAALIPEKYIADLHERLGIYQRLAVAKDSQEVYDVVGQVADTYGDPPAEVTALADLMVLKQRLREMAARSLEIAQPMDSAASSSNETQPPPKIVISLGETSRLDPQKLARLASEASQFYRITPNGKLIYTVSEGEWKQAGEDLMGCCRQVLRRVLDEAGGQAKAA